MHLRLAKRHVRCGLVLGQALESFPREIQSGEVGVFSLENLDDAAALSVVFEAAVILHEFVEGLLAGMAARRVAKVVREGNRLGEVLVQPQRTGDVAGDGGHLHRVGEASAEVLPAAAKKHLCLVLQSAKGARMDNAVAIALKLGAPLGRFLGVVASAGVGAKLRVGGECVAFAGLEFCTVGGHPGSVKRGSSREGILWIRRAVRRRGG